MSPFERLVLRALWVLVQHTLGGAASSAHVFAVKTRDDIQNALDRNKV